MDMKKSIDEINAQYANKCALLGEKQFRIGMLTDEIKVLQIELRALSDEARLLRPLNQMQSKETP